MSSDYIVLEKDRQKRIAWITFNRPEAHNMMTQQDGAQYHKVLRELEDDDDVKVIILRGAGESFGTGADMRSLGPDTLGFSLDPKAPRPTLRRRLILERKASHDNRDEWGIMSTWHVCKPVIAQVHGYCYGWHFIVMWMSDIVIASEEALFTHPALRYIAESVPAMSWMNDMGYHKTAELMFTGRAFTAREMEEMGVVNRVVPRQDLEKEVLEYASVIATQALDTLVLQKHYLETLRSMKNETLTGNLVALLVHMTGSYMKPDPDDFVVLKETAKLGPSGAIDKREQKYSPRWRLSYKGRAAKE